VYPPMWAHWRHLANTIEFVFSSALQVHNPKGKSIDSAVVALLTADTLPWAPLSPKNCPFPWGDLDRHLTHDSLSPSEPTTQPKRHLDRFSRFCMAH